MNSLEIVFTHNECDIFYNRKYHVIITLWKGKFVPEDTFRQILDNIIVAIELKKTSIVIADAREMQIISKENQQWILSSWYPRALKAGFRFQGLILPVNTFNELTVKKISEEYDKTIVTTQYFSSPVEATNWVKELQREDTAI